MIDTVRFKVKVDERLSKLIQQKSTEFTKKDNATEELKFKFFRSDPQLGSFDNSISIIIDDYDMRYVSIEFSLPKYLYGSNLWLLYPSQVKQALDGLYKELVEHFSDFPAYETWEVTRLDISYAWRLQDEQAASQALEVLRSFEYFGKRPESHDTSFYHVGVNYTISSFVPDS